MNRRIKAAGEVSRYAEQTTLAASRLEALAAMAGTFAADLHDPAAVEVLLVLREVCYVLELAPAELEAVFSPRILRLLEDFGDIVPPRQRPPDIRRVWVWQSSSPRPQLCRLDGDGALWLGGGGSGGGWLDGGKASGEARDKDAPSLAHRLAARAR